MKHTVSYLTLITMLSLGSCSSTEKTDEKTNETDSSSVAVVDTNAKDTINIHGKIEFKSLDSLPVTADSYEVLPGEKYILLCHQAGFSRGEYTETAKKLNELGYNCLAIDQRSGETCNDVENETAKRAKDKKLKTEFLDAQQDIEAAVNYVYKHCGKKIIVVGSSYSAALLLRMGKMADKIAAVALFSPGECFDKISIQKEAAALPFPLFATSSKKEAKDLATLLSAVKAQNKTIFVPAGEGDHGSKVLWPNAPGNEEYWNAFEDFLKKVETTR